MEIGQIAATIFLDGMIAGYLFLGVWILVKAINSSTGGGRPVRSIARDPKHPFALARDVRRWANMWMQRTIKQRNQSVK